MDSRVTRKEQPVHELAELLCVYELPAYLGAIDKEKATLSSRFFQFSREPFVNRAANQSCTSARMFLPASRKSSNRLGT